LVVGHQLLNYIENLLQENSPAGVQSRWTDNFILGNQMIIHENRLNLAFFSVEP